MERELDAYLLSVKGDFIASAREKLSDRKEKDNIMFFDDLLVKLRSALEKRGGEELAGVIRSRFRAALID